MRSNTPARMHVIKKEEKEANLTAFVRQNLAHRTAGEGSVCDYRVIARSMESPVARVITSMAQEISDSGIAIRMLLIQTASSPDSAEAAGSGMQAASVAKTRIIRDIRILDAHEQLVLSPTAAWIGDCMRREPAKRDAYECYSPDCAQIADWAATSFERLWSAGEMIELTPVVAAVTPEPVADLAVLSMVETTPTHEASTRH